MTDTHRLTSIDALRGIVIALMALDHVRDFWGAGFWPDNLEVTTPVWFFTRWITHFCAPVFVLLAGTGTFLFESRGRSKAEVSRFLLSRGLWLIFLELTIINFSWFFPFTLGLVWVQVIWALGVSMLVLAGAIYIPRKWLLALSLIMIAGHNLLDSITVADGLGGVLWSLLHVQTFLPLWEGMTFMIGYPVVPWIGVMALGYAIGPIFTMPQLERRRLLQRIGVASIALFVVIRIINGYGDPNSWVSQARGAEFTVLSFFNATKYPPSLVYLLMTLGPALLLLPYLEGWRGKAADFMITLGRVPMFFYVVHIPFIHITSLVWGKLFWGAEGSLLFKTGSQLPVGYESSLLRVYFVWFITLAIMLPLCRWFMDVKKRRSEWWLKYL